MEISDGSDVVGLFEALAKMDMNPLSPDQSSGRNRRSGNSEGNMLTSLNSAFISCALVLVAFGAIITRKRPSVFRVSRNDNRTEGNL